MPASTEPPMVVVHRCPAVRARSNMNVDVDDRAWCRLPPADSGGVVDVGQRRSIVLDGRAVEKPRARVDGGGWFGYEASHGFSAGFPNGLVPVRTT